MTIFQLQSTTGATLKPRRRLWINRLLGLENCGDTDGAGQSMGHDHSDGKQSSGAIMTDISGARRLAAVEPEWNGQWRLLKYL